MKDSIKKGVVCPSRPSAFKLNPIAAACAMAIIGAVNGLSLNADGREGQTTPFLIESFIKISSG